ncbi:Repeat domain-containing protein [Actinokineospora alba]|uniref:Repeat domain-containing protein n=1 Tax=Actinokineospora alba TaxID=504798 RepID=A0A1H0HEY1_9PSEU|nr:CRTAC1 family protein [Actinokineospora alba]TDP64922.1 VCBS repeat protein [Actinokineospora alba]SDH49450.1 Repeat domain-containing protein [Actinokineospora alba]SDO17411.1 Repeat domain-containing protein [Actinokineospora alba]
MTAILGMLRRQLTGVIALVVVVGFFFAVTLPQSSAETKSDLASDYAFAGHTPALPTSDKQQSIRKVNKAYKHIDAWMSSVGAAVAMNDLDGDGLPNDLCLVDPRTDQVIVTPTPGKGEKRYQPFELDAAPLPVNDVMAPMGCVPADLNEDGRMDLLIYMWGRTPVIHLQKASHGTLSADAFKPTEAVPGDNAGPNGEYDGPQWNSNAATVADLNGDGHDDIFIGNYFPDGPIIDPSKDGGVTMNHSLSHAQNGGEKHILLCKGATAGQDPTATFGAVPADALPEEARNGWTLGVSANDLDGDLLPELYIANDFGQDRLLYNKSTPDKVSFANVETTRTPGTPKSKRIGEDSFKGMGVDFGDTNHDGLYDAFVSNLTVGWGIVESNFHFVNTAANQADLRAKLQDGEAPFRDVSGGDGTAWAGWSWDVKLADFANTGEQQIAQTNGFIKGSTNRWPQLQELAMANDSLVANPAFWPNANAGDDIAGSETLRFFVKGPDGRYTDVAPELGLAVPIPTRGIATGDADGDGLLDFAVARQYGEPIFYHNEARAPGGYLNLVLTHEQAASAGSAPAPGSPATGAQVTVTTADGKKYIQRVDGGSGHGGKRSSEVHIGLGDAKGPVEVQLKWRDRQGKAHEQVLRLEQGKHALVLGDTAEER